MREDLYLCKGRFLPYVFFGTVSKIRALLLSIAVILDKEESGCKLLKEELTNLRL